MVSIVNDIAIPVEFYVYGQTKKPVFVLLKPGEQYQISEPDAELRIEKDDVWENTSRSNQILMLFYSLDLVFGDMSHTHNLPYSIYASLSNKDIIHISKAVKVSPSSIKAWKRFCSIQFVLVCSLLAMIGIGFSFIIPILSLQILFIILICMLCFWLLLKLRKRRNVLLFLICNLGY